MSVLEDRYRSLLRLLPASYRATWEEDMVTTFLDTMAVDDPEDVELLADFGRPTWSEAASVVALAVRLRRGGADASPRSFAWGQAVRRVALIGLLILVVTLAPVGVAGALWVGGMIPWLPPADEVMAGSLTWHIVWGLVGLVGVAAYVALLFGRRRAGRLLAVLAFVPFVVDAIVSTADLLLTEPGPPGALVAVVHLFEGLGSFLVPAVLLLAVAAFHRDAPPLPRRPWLVALAVVIAVSSILHLVFLTQLPPDAPDLWWLLFDPAGLWSVALVTAAIVHLAGRELGRASRSPVWPLALALLAPVVLAARVLSVLHLAFPDPFGGRSVLVAAIVEAVAVVAVGVGAGVLARQALRRLSPASPRPPATVTSTP